MERLLRWLGIRLIIRSCLHRALNWNESRKSYVILNRGAIYVALVGQEPGTSFGSPGRRIFVLIGECVNYLVDRTVLRTPGAFFVSRGILQVRPGPGVNWCWYLQIGR